MHTASLVILLINMVRSTNTIAVHLLMCHLAGLCVLVDIVLGCLDGMSACQNCNAKYQYLLGRARQCVVDMTKLNKRGKVMSVYNWTMGQPPGHTACGLCRQCFAMCHGATQHLLDL